MYSRCRLNTLCAHALIVALTFFLIPATTFACKYGCCAAVIGGKCAGACCPKPVPKGPCPGITQCSQGYCNCSMNCPPYPEKCGECKSSNSKTCYTKDSLGTPNCLDTCNNYCHRMGDKSDSKCPVKFN